MIRLSFFLFVLLFISACCDEVILTEEPDTSAAIYSPLAIGNYWIYQESIEQVDGSFQPKSTLDSVYIEKDTVVDGNRFFIIEGNRFAGPGNRYDLRRDSMGYLVDNNNNIYYSPKDNDGILNTKVNYMPDGQFLFSVSNLMQPVDSLSLPAGDFETRVLIGSIAVNEDRLPNCGIDNETHYAKEVGIVKDQVYYSVSCSIVKIELLRYNVNK